MRGPLVVFTSRALLLAVSGCAIVAAAAPASAQYHERNRNVSVRERPQPGYDPIGIPIGAFRGYATLPIGVLYTDNVFATPDGEEDMIITIRPGAAFDGFNRVLAMTGHWWDTALSTYNSIAQIHLVQWIPQGSTLLVGAGSVVNGRVFIQNDRTVQLLGDLTFQGSGNSFDPRSGSALLNAPGGSTITFQGSSDLAPTAGL